MLGSETRRDWGRRYPSLLLLAGAIVLAAFALPSSLSIPEASPGQTLEYAPVPPNGQAPPGGNLAALGLGSSGTLGSEASGGPLGLPPGLGGNPSSKECVGNPPRQTEDPLSPPCVAYFKGDNGGSTHTGVTRSEVTVLFRMDVPSDFSYTNDSYSDTHGPPTGYYDMDNPNDVNQFFAFVYLHNWEVYFNHRYQTYDRHIHFWVYNFNQSATGSSYSPANSQAEAVDNWNTKHPFAALQSSHFDDTGNFPFDYATYMARRGVLSFGSYDFTQDQASMYPGLFWSFPPSLDSQAQEYASFVCRRIVKPGRVSFSGNGDTGSPRKYGLLLTSDQSAQATRTQQSLTVQYLRSDCGIQIADTKYFAYSGGEAVGPQSGWGVSNMAAFRSEGITTILWPGGDEVDDMNAASQQHWYPEWVMEGDGALDGLAAAGQERADEMAHAWVTTPQALIDNSFGVEGPCLDALEEVDPGISRTFSDIIIACFFYDDLRQLFTGIQLAGPQLTPETMDEGFHAIPPRPSTSPYVPSCYYLPGDYTCVKDAAAEWWDSTAHPNGYASTQTGCWRMWRGGQRYLTGQWPEADVTQGVTPGDVCNLFSGTSAYLVRTT